MITNGMAEALVTRAEQIKGDSHCQSEIVAILVRLGQEMPQLLQTVAPEKLLALVQGLEFAISWDPTATDWARTLHVIAEIRGFVPEWD